MQVYIGFGTVAIVALALIVVRWMVERARQQPDIQWKPTGYRYLHTGHDQTLGQRSAMRAAVLVGRRVALASERSMPLSVAGRGAAGVVDMRFRRVRN
jgi:hypothetical protein